MFDERAAFIKICNEGCFFSYLDEVKGNSGTSSRGDEDLE